MGTGESRGEGQRYVRVCESNDVRHVEDKSEDNDGDKTDGVMVG